MLDELYRQKAVVIHRETDPAVAIRKALEVREGGLTVQEVTWTTTDAAGVIAALAKKRIGTLGAGSILNPAQAKQAFDAGARFLVSPVYAKDVHAFCRRKKIPYVPGAATPQEIWDAWERGCRPVKVFPAPTLGGPEFIRRLLGPMPFLELLPTSLGFEDIQPYLEAGARAIGLGTAFTSAVDLATRTARACGIIGAMK